MDLKNIHRKARGGLIILPILLMIIPGSLGQCAYDEFDNGGTCQVCWQTYPGCITGDSGGCLSCMEGMYIAETNFRVCVQSGDAMSITTYTETSAFFADPYTRKCQKCGDNCGNCVDNQGCTSGETGKKWPKT